MASCVKLVLQHISPASNLLNMHIFAYYVFSVYMINITSIQEFAPRAVKDVTLMIT